MSKKRPPHRVIGGGGYDGVGRLDHYLHEISRIDANDVGWFANPTRVPVPVVIIFIEFFEDRGVCSYEVVGMNEMLTHLDIQERN